MGAGGGGGGASCTWRISGMTLQANGSVRSSYCTAVRDALFLPCHLTPRPVVVVRLQLTGVDALNGPLGVEDNLSLLARILAV